MTRKPQTEPARDLPAFVAQRLAALADVEQEVPAIVLISGGGDSTALLHALVRARGGEAIHALHVNYGLRGEASDADEAFCRELCSRLGCPLTVIVASPHESGNLQDWARELRYAAAEELARKQGDECMIIVAHNADDQAETLLYRLFASPGRRALNGIPERRGRIVRPLLTVRRAELRAWLATQGETWREDASNDDERFARVRARKLLAQAELLHPAAIENLLRTADALREEGEELAEVVGGLTAELTTEAGALDLDRLAELSPALGGAVLREYVEARRPVPVPQAPRLLTDALRLGRGGERKELQVEGARIVVQSGVARVIED